MRQIQSSDGSAMNSHLALSRQLRRPSQWMAPHRHSYLGDHPGCLGEKSAVSSLTAIMIKKGAHFRRPLPLYFDPFVLRARINTTGCEIDALRV